VAPPPAHVLIVEDSALVVSAIRILLEDAGFRVSAALTAAEAMARARDDRPDAMLLDLSLPDGDGLSVLAALRESGAAPRVTVAFTGRDEPATRARCLEAGCRDVLVKPIAPLALAGQLRGWLGEG
jgi:DNA-binding response OmpR family regulator